jgi:hypothetical protein
MKRNVAMSFLIMSLVLCMTACSDNDLLNVSKSMAIYGTTLTEVQKNIIAAEKVGFISEENTGKALDICMRANVAGQQVVSVIGAIQKLDPVSRKKILALLTPISDSLDPTKIEFVLAIKDPAMKQKIEGGFILLRTTVSSIMVISQASGG